VLVGLIARRMALGLFTLLLVSLLVFAGTEILPGDVAEAVLGQSATPETVAVIRRELNLDQPAPVRYGDWLLGFVTGDLGRSLASGLPITEIMAPRLAQTLTLGAATAMLAVPLSLALGLLAAMRPGTRFDRTVNTGTILATSTPEFLVATLLVLVFSVKLRWFPAMSYLWEGAGFAERIEALALPVMTLMAMVLAPMTRMTRSAVLDVMTSPAIEMALLKGVPRRRLIVRHALPNALGPIVNVIAMNLAYLVSGVVVVEVVFSYPGVAKLMVDAVATRDLPLVQVCAMFFCLVYVALNLAADVVSMIANPRLRHPR